MHFLGIEHRDDGVTKQPGGHVTIVDPWNVPILYDAAVQDLSGIQLELLRLGSHYVFSERRRREAELSRLQLSRTDNLVAENIDREQLLCDLLECELQYQMAKVHALEYVDDIE